MSQPIIVLVLANKPAALSGLVKVLDDRFRIIIHMDAKVNAEEIDLPSHATMLQHRIPVFWGGFSICAAACALIDEAYRLYPYFRRLVLITGDSLPTVNLDALELALMDMSKEYIQLTEIPNDPSLRGASQDEAVRRYGFAQPWRFHNFIFWDDEILCPRSREDTMRKFGIDGNTADYMRGSVGRIMEDLLARMPPRPPLFEKFFYGELSWALTRSATDLIIDEIHSKSHIEYFRYFQVPDEHFFHTLLGNKAQALASVKKTIAGNLVYLDDTNPARAEFKGQDCMSADGFRAAYQNRKCLFARKYDPAQSSDIAVAIDEGRYFGDVLGG